MFFLQHCNKVFKDYLEPSVVMALIIEDSIIVHSNDPAVVFDRSPLQVSKHSCTSLLTSTHAQALIVLVYCLFAVPNYFNFLQILKRDIDIPVEIPDLIDYPPRLSIGAQTASTASPRVQVDGLDRECVFNLIPIPCESLAQCVK